MTKTHGYAVSNTTTLVGGIDAIQAPPGEARSVIAISPKSHDGSIQHALAGVAESASISAKIFFIATPYHMLDGLSSFYFSSSSGTFSKSSWRSVRVITH